MGRKDSIPTSASGLSAGNSNEAIPCPDLVEDIKFDALKRRVLADLARQIVATRAIRSHFLFPELFGEPAWDILLTLYIAEVDQYRLKVTSICNESGVPETTALRWIESLDELGLVSKARNPTDLRSRFVKLTPAGLAAMDQLLTLAIRNLDVGRSSERR